MAVKVELNDAAANLFKSLVIKRIIELKDQIGILKAELTENEILLKELSQDYSSGVSIMNNPPPPLFKVEDSDYKPTWTWEEKIKYILNGSELPLSTADIVKKIMDLEPNKYERASLVGSISATLSIKSKPGKTFAITGKNDRNENLFTTNSKLVNQYI